VAKTVKPESDATKGYRVALDEARAGMREGGIPIGSALIKGREVLGAGHNRRLQNADPTAHAEIECLRAVGPLDSYAGATLFTTLTPCYLCSGAVILFAIPKVIVGESETYDGEGSLDWLMSHHVEIENLHDSEARSLLRSFIEQNREVWLADIGK
jgi:cytosine deaminase